jgi:ribonucleoside-diphosphate reductase alpha chain
MAKRIAICMRDAAYAASVQLAVEKGAFPKFDAEAYLKSGSFASRLPEALQADIRLHGIRNSHLLSIAPTGTVSLAFADNTSNGIEPAFAWVYRRKKRIADGQTVEYAVEDHAWRCYRSLGGDINALPDYFVSALEMTASAHVQMMQSVQPFVDTAISKTVNVPEDFAYDEFKGLYQQAWDAGLKGVATYRPNGILGSVLQTGPKQVNASSKVTDVQADPMRTVIESRPNGALPAVAEKIDYWTSEGLKTLYLLVSFMQVPCADGSKKVDRAIEFFMPVGQSGESQQWITSSMRLLSLAARGGFLERALSDMRKVIWDRGPVRLGSYLKAEGNQVPMWHDSEVAAIAYAIQKIIEGRNLVGENPNATLNDPLINQPTTHVMAGKKCQECGAHAVIKKDGCEFCTQCGHIGACG